MQFHRGRDRDEEVWNSREVIKTSLFISLCILRDLPQQKIPRELCSEGDPIMFPCSHGKIFCWDGSGKFKNTRRKGADQENSKKQEGKNGGKKKKRFLCMSRFPYSCVFHRSGTPWEYRPHATSLRRTHSYGNLPYNKIPYQHSGQNWSAWKGDYCLLQPAQISAVVIGPSFMLVNFPRTNLWGLWQKYVSLCFENQ